MRPADTWKDYELLDATDGNRLERWGETLLIRPDPQVVWKTPKQSPLWAKADAIYHRSNQGGGEWEYRRRLPEKWKISCGEGEDKLTLIVSPTGFKHTGVFPEQAVNWAWYQQKIRAANRPVMHVMKSNYYYAWHFVPFLVLASTCSCFNQFMNSVYVVTKKSQRSMVTMMAGAISNCIMNYFFIKWWGPVGATYASFLGLALVFTLRAVDARRMIGMHVHPARVLANAAVLVFEAFVLLAEPPLYGLWTGLITLVIILYNFAGVWAMARVLLPRLLGRRGKALVAAVDGWLKPKKA